MRSNMPPQKDFSRNPQVGKARSVFNRTTLHKSTMESGHCVPFFIDEILPGDSMDLKANIFARLSSTMEFPIMDNLHLDIHFFYVPFRILWENWERFMGARDNPDDSIDFQVPQVAGTAAVQSLADYFGVPPNIPYSISALYHRAYYKIWNDWYRDENLQDSLDEETGDGPEVDADYELQKRGKRHDYFTSCLPWPQKGDEVAIGLSGTAPVIGDGKAFVLTDEYAGTPYAYGFRAFADNMYSGDGVGQTLPYYDGTAADVARANQVLGLHQDPDTSGVIADLDGASAISINDLRTAVATQQLLELDARGGTRYFEILKQHFGVDSPDGRLQRPEFLGGGTRLINVNPVTQTSQSDSTFQGNQAAYVTGTSRQGFSKSFVEHGLVMGIMSVRADLTYQQGIDRMLSRVDRFDFYFPSFANLGEQAVLNKEIFLQNTSADDEVFGYNERWSEYRYKPSKISGRFRSDVADSIDAWHLSQDFASLPVLGSTFIEENVPLDRTLTVTAETTPQIIFDSYTEIRHARVMPVYSIPGLQRL